MKKMKIKRRSKHKSVKKTRPKPVEKPPGHRPEPVVQQNIENDDSLEDDAASVNSDGELLPGSHKHDLEVLKEKDPEFYQYLKSHDKELLEFDDEKDDIDDNLLDEKEEIKKDEQDTKVTANDVEQWRKSLQNSSARANYLIAIKSVIRAFRRAVNQTTDSTESVMNLIDPSVFNLIINTCLTQLVTALLHYLRLKNVKTNLELKQIETGEEHGDEENEDGDLVFRSPFFDPRRSRNWKRVLAHVKMYLTDVLKMVDLLSPDARVSFERHLLELVPFFNVFPHLIKKIIKRSIGEWTSGEERSRVLAFLILYRSIRVIQSNDHLNKTERQTLVNHILRRLYLAYANASKTTNEITIEKIAFMRNSLVELYQLDHSLAYQQAFIFMRQLCINIRKSILVKEKDALKKVFNWQYVHSISLWSQLIGSAHKRTTIFVPLLSPIINISFQTIHLFAPFKYMPFRLQIIDSMVKLASETQVFIPILKFINEMINQIVSQKNDIISKAKSLAKQKKKSSKVANKPINLNVMLKVSKEQSIEMEFIERVVERIYEQLLYYLKSQSSNILFPEMVMLFHLDVRKKIKLIPYAKGKTMMKQLLDKIEESSMFVMKIRQEKQLSIRNLDQIETMEKEIEQDPDKKTPLVKFYEQWKQFKTKQKSLNGQDMSFKKKSLKFTEKELNKKTEFNMETDLKREIEMNGEDDEDGEELNDEELAALEENGQDDDDDNDFDESIDEFDEDDEIELNEEQMKKLQAQIEKAENKLKGLNDAGGDDGESSTKKRKRNRKRNRKNKKARTLNPDLELDGAFDLSSSDDDNE